MELNNSLIKKRFFIPFFILLTVFFCLPVHGQSLLRIEDNSGGFEKDTHDIIITYSIGGVAVECLNNSSEGIITQGYQQLDSIFIESITNSNIIISATPNPCTSFINIKLTNIANPTNCRIEVLTLMGTSSALNKDFYFENNVPISVVVDFLKPGIYWLKLYEKGSSNLMGCVKIVKLQK